jgi:hypothetical protein
MPEMKGKVFPEFVKTDADYAKIPLNQRVYHGPNKKNRQRRKGNGRTSREKNERDKMMTMMMILRILPKI